MKKLAELRLNKENVENKKFLIDADGTLWQNRWPTADGDAVTRMSKGIVQLDRSAVFQMFKNALSNAEYYKNLAEITLKSGYTLPKEHGSLTVDKKIDKVIEHIKQAQSEVMQDHYKVVKYRKWVPEVLTYLKSLGAQLAIFTNCESSIVKHAEQNPKLRFEEFYSTTFTSDMVEHKKPAPDMFDLATKHFGDNNKSNYMMIGDGEPDIKGAYDFGIESINIQDPRSVTLEEQKRINKQATFGVKNWGELKRHIEITECVQL